MKEEFLNKAKENLKIAQLSFEHDCYNACANRAYFASFQAAVAALADKGIRNERNEHAWVQSEFNFQLIKRRKIYSGKLKSYLLNMQDSRNIADYSGDSISKKLARKQLSRATEMIYAIEKELSG
ncbi:MAG: HEPN domain-containing protein [Desulfobacteraceae bacterium]|nr:HEPN domain-containing protein [Desulfobacteraceae bacterium]